MLARPDETDIQLRQAAQSSVFPPFQFLVQQFRIQKPPQQRIEGDLSFHPSQRRPEAEMCCPAKSEMAIVGSESIRAVRIRKPLRIAIRCNKNCHDTANPKRRFRNESDPLLKWFPSMHTSKYGACPRIVACGLLPSCLLASTSALLP
jgi:hypothetical protein